MNPVDDQHLLRESEEKHRALVETTGAAYVINLSDYTIQLASKTLGTNLPLGITCHALTHRSDKPCDDADNPCTIEKVKQSGKDVVLVHTHYDAHGNARLVELHASPVVDSQGHIVQVIESTLDITGRRQVEEALKTSEERFRTTAESITDVVYEWDLKDKLDWFGDIDGLMGYPAGGFPRTIDGWAAAIHPEDQDRVKGAIEGQLKRAAPYAVEYRVRNKDGEWRWWSARGTALRDERGEPYKWIGAITDVTERKRAEEVLRESEARYRTLVENIPQKIFMKDRSFRWVSVNENLARDLGIRPEEVVGKVDCEFFPKELADKYRADDVRIMETGKTEELEEKYLQEGKEVWVNTIKTPVRDSHGEIIGVFGIFWDITERKRAEEVLQESEQRFKAIFDHSNDGILIADTEKKRFTLGNETICQMLGYSPDEIKDLGVMDIHPPEDLPYVIDQFEKQARKEIDIAKDLPVARKDGRIFFADVSAFPITLAGKPYLVGAFRDTTERKQGEAEIERRAALEELIVDISTRFINIPPAETDREIVNLLQLIAEYVAADRSYVFLLERGYAYEWRAPGVAPHSPPDGEFEEDVFPWWLGKLSKDGRVVLPDVSHLPAEAERERKALEAQHIRALLGVPMIVQGTLEGFLGMEFMRSPVDERALGIYARLVSIISQIIVNAIEHKRDKQALRQAKEGAEAANQAKSDFLASMSHEIRTPMNAILGMAELLDEAPLSDEQHQYLDVLKNAGTNLLGLINDILDLSKIEAGQIELENIPLDLREVVEKTCEVMALQAHRKGLELICRIADNLPPALTGDPVRIRQVLINLIGNALKFTEAGEVAVQVKMLGLEDGQSRLEFSIRDTGIGIPPEKIAKIFERFTQVDSSTTRKYGGSGLGLAITKRLVEKMYGRLWAESEVGRGSTFFFTAILGLSEAEPPSSSAIEDFTLRGWKCLIVDDNATNRLILKEALTNWGARVVEAGSGEQGLEELKRAAESAEPYQVVLLDSQMPMMDGFGVAERIQQNPKFAGITMMMLTSDNRSGDLARIQNLGIKVYLIKPVKRSDLYQALARALGGKRTPPDPSAAARVPLSSPALAAQPEKRLLVVDDSPDNRFLVQAFLKRQPYRLDMATHGEEALALVKQQPYDLVLMDMQMPVMDGYTATRKIREWEAELHRPSLPIIALTAYAMKGDEEKTLAAGCSDYLAKPIVKARLLELLEKHLRVEEAPCPSAKGPS